MAFLVSYGALTVSMSEMLGMRFTPGSPAQESPVGASLKATLRYHNEGKYELRDTEMAKLALFERHLLTIKARPDVLRVFAQRMRSPDAWNQYFGTRLEVNIAASLLRKGVEFEKTEPPDFTIHWHGNQLLLECGSAHLTERKDTDVRYKLDSVIHEKSAKPYCCPAAALCIDGTNILFSAAYNDVAWTKAELVQYIRCSLRRHSSAFGSVLVFTYIIDRNRRRFESNYLRIDNAAPDVALVSFLDEFYPRGEHHVDSWAYPNYG